MTTTVYSPASPLIAGQAYQFTAFLFDATDALAFKASPTLAAGDVLVSVDGGAQAA
jgi:hypothetical protein